MTQTFLLDDPAVTTLEQHLARGGGAGLARAMELGPYQIIEEVNLAGLRGQGRRPRPAPGVARGS